MNVKLNRKIIGLQPKPVNYTTSSRKYDAEQHKQKRAREGGFQDEKQQLKALQDRVHILEQELQRAREESFQAGFEEGRERGFADTQKEVQKKEHEMNELTSGFNDALNKLEVPLLKLARKMAERVVKIEISKNKDLDLQVLEGLRQGLQEVIEENKVLIRLNPSHLETFTKLDLNKDLNVPGKMEINLVGDKHLQKGESIVESDNYILDGTYSGQLDHLTDQMIKEASE